MGVDGTNRRPANPIISKLMDIIRIKLKENEEVEKWTYLRH